MYNHLQEIPKGVTYLSHYCLQPAIPLNYSVLLNAFMLSKCCFSIFHQSKNKNIALLKHAKMLCVIMHEIKLWNNF